MDTRSEAVLAGVIPALATKVRTAADPLASQGTYLLVVSGLRTAQQQNALYAQGRTTAGHIVTNAKAGQSNHNYGLAVDVVPYLSGDGGALNWQPQSPQFQAMVAALKEQGLEWGGDWKGHLADDDHFQLGGLPASPSPEMVQDYEFYDGNLITIWAKAEAGDYAPEPA